MDAKFGPHNAQVIHYFMKRIPRYHQKVWVDPNEVKLKMLSASEITPNQVHLLVKALPKFSPGAIISIFKVIISRSLKKDFNILHPSFWA